MIGDQVIQLIEEEFLEGSDSEEEEDVVEIEQAPSDDSDKDPDFNPTMSDIEDEILMNVRPTVRGTSRLNKKGKKIVKKSQNKEIKIPDNENVGTKKIKLEEDELVRKDFTV